MGGSVIQAAYRAHRYDSADGRLTLFARDYSATSEADARAPLLMMHGLTRNSADFEPLIEHLDADRRIIVPDQRGRGLSDYDPQAENYRPETYVADMWALLGSLKTERAVLIGTSLGGLMAMLMGAARPDRVVGIVLNDVGPEVDAAGLNRIRSYVGGDEAMAGWDEAAARCEATNGSALAGFGPKDWTAFARRTCTEQPDGRVRFSYDPAISQGIAEDEAATVPPDLWSLWDMLAPIPVLALRGENSDILSRETVAEMARRHPDAFSHVEIPARGHAPILDEPAAVSAILTFLSKVD